MRSTLPDNSCIIIIINFIINRIETFVIYLKIGSRIASVRAAIYLFAAHGLSSKLLCMRVVLTQKGKPEDSDAERAHTND